MMNLAIQNYETEAVTWIDLPRWAAASACSTASSRATSPTSAAGCERFLHNSFDLLRERFLSQLLARFGLQLTMAKTAGTIAMSQRAAIRNHKLKSSLTGSASWNSPISCRQRRLTTTLGVNTKQLRTRSLSNLPLWGTWSTTIC
jgi:hypothetical protein